MPLSLSGKKTTNVSICEESALQSKQTKPKLKSAFEQILKSVGFVVGDKNEPNELNVDQAEFLRDLTKCLAEKLAEVDEFTNGFEMHLEDEIRLKWSLMPTVTTATCEIARNASQDSLIHLLLNIEIVQEKVASVMLDKLAEFSYVENSVLYDRSENKSVACLIVSQFRWLNKLVNSDALSDKLIELIEATPFEVQRDIIKLLPDVISEFDHSKVAKCLANILHNNQELNVSILDALTNLNVEADLISEIRKQEIEIVSSAKISDLPVIIKFILQDLTSDEAFDTINELRKNLDFNSAFSPIISSTPINPKIRESPKDVASCVLNTIKNSLKFQKSVCEAWIKVLECLKGPRSHKSLDILIILVLLSLEVVIKKVENTLKNKIKIGDINEDLLHVTYRCHHEILQEYAPILLKLSESLLRSNESTVSVFGCSLYVKCFIWFDAFYKQEVIGNLITHVGNKSENEVNAALDTLLSLAELHTQKIAPYSLFVKTLIDHIDDLTLNQIRKVHETLSILAYQGGREGSMLLDDILIVVRKQLTSKNIKYRKMGVIGALMAAKTAAVKENDEFIPDVSVSSDVLDNTTCYEHAVKLLELVAESTSDSNEAFALFCDELSVIMLQKKIGKIVLEWVGEHILAEFEEHYIIDVNIDEYNGKDVYPRFVLDEVNEPVALNLYNIVMKNNEFLNSNILHDSLNNKRIKKSNIKNESKILNTLLKASDLVDNTGISNECSASPIKLAPIFRLLRIFKQIQDGNLDAIDALLGCSIILPELRFLKMNSLEIRKQHLMLDLLFYCANWIRENINAFSNFTDEDIKYNVLTRLQLLVELEELICLYINQIQDYSPPIANFDFEESQLVNLKLPAKKSTKRSAKDKKKKLKKPKMDENSEQQSLNDSKSLKDSDSDEFESKSTSDTSILRKLQPYFREFDFEIFSLLNSVIIFHKRIDVFSNEKIMSLQIHPKEVKFLLEDLDLKLNHIFNAPAINFKIVPKKIGFSNLEALGTQKVILHCINLLPPLCNILEACATFFKNLADECDGVEDSLLLFTADSQRILDCMNLIFKAMNQIISWKNLNLSENASILKKILFHFASRLDASVEKPSLSELIRVSINYFNLFINSVPSLVSASNLVQLLKSFLYFTDDDESKTKVSNIALKFLQKSWPETNSKSLKTSLINDNVKILLGAYLTNNKEVLKSLEYLAAEGIPQIVNDDPVVFSTLTKSSLICYYKMMFSKLCDYMKFYLNKEQMNKDRLLEWSIVFKIFQVLTFLIKTFGNRSYIVICLKYSREFMSLFLKYGMPLMDKLFQSNKEDVVYLMKTLQVSTRYLQHVCSHSKVVKDASLLSHVPFLKKNLEIFVFKVKIMLTLHKCEEAFCIGNLKHRDIKGTVISSQFPQHSGDDTDAEKDDEVDENKSDSDAPGIASEAENND